MNGGAGMERTEGKPNHETYTHTRESIIHANANTKMPPNSHNNNDNHKKKPTLPMAKHRVIRGVQRVHVSAHLHAIFVRKSYFNSSEWVSECVRCIHYLIWFDLVRFSVSLVQFSSDELHQNFFSLSFIFHKLIFPLVFCFLCSLRPDSFQRLLLLHVGSLFISCGLAVSFAIVVQMLNFNYANHFYTVRNSSHLQFV